MINQGSYKLIMDENGWTARTADGRLSAQYEHTIAITKKGPLLTEQEGVESFRYVHFSEIRKGDCSWISVLLAEQMVQPQFL